MPAVVNEFLVLAGLAGRAQTRSLMTRHDEWVWQTHPSQARKEQRAAAEIGEEGPGTSEGRPAQCSRWQKTFTGASAQRKYGGRTAVLDTEEKRPKGRTEYEGESESGPGLSGREVGGSGLVDGGRDRQCPVSEVDGDGTEVEVEAG